MRDDGFIDFLMTVAGAMVIVCIATWVWALGSVSTDSKEHAPSVCITDQASGYKYCGEVIK